MTPATDFLSGVPVDVDPPRIERELAALWKPASDSSDPETAVVRACVANVVVFADEESALREVSDAVEGLARRRPNRSILLVLDRDGGRGAAGGDAGQESPRASPLRARVSAVCHLPFPRAAPVCCERIVLSTSPETADLLAGALPPLLVPDIPVYVWWRGRDLAAPLLARIADSADRVVVDTRLDGAPEALRSLARLLEERLAPLLADLGWRSTLAWRRAIAELFEEVATRELIPDLYRIEIAYRGRLAGETSPPPAGALLLAGWIVSRLGFVPGPLRAAPDQLGWRADVPASREPCEIVLAAESGESESRLANEITAVRFRSRILDGEAHVAIELDPKRPETARVSSHTASACQLPKAVAFQRGRELDLLTSVLEGPPEEDGFDAALASAIALLPEASPPTQATRGEEEGEAPA